MLEEFKDKGDSSTEGLLKSILESAFNGIMTLKSIRNERDEIIDFEWLFVNDIAADITGMEAKKIMGSRLLTLMPGNKDAGLFDKYKQVVETGQFNTFEQFYPGEQINSWFRISAVKLGDGFTVTFQDITDLKEAVLEAESKEKKYQQLFEESIDAIFSVDENFRFIEVNQPFQRLFQFPKDELVCMTLESLFVEQDAYQLFRKMLLKDSIVDEHEVTLLDKSGGMKSCLINSASLSSDDQEEASFIGVIRDMTKRRQAEKELIQAEKLSMTGKLARTIAHEVRNPLTNLTLALEQLKDEVPEEVEDADLYFNIISRNADRIGKLISDLLNSSKPKDLQLKKQSLNHIVNEALALVKDRLKLQSIKLQKSLSDNLPDIALDNDQMKIALLNLFINAVEAMKPEVGKMLVATALEDDRIYLRISDNGKGIAKEAMNDLFEPFFTGKKEGTGLGLTTVQNIIHSHKGRIEAESEVGEGTTFILSFQI